MFHHHAPHSSTATERQVPGVALTSPNMPIGANLAPLAYYDTTPVFTDLVYQGQGLFVQGTTTPVAVDATDGWPVQDGDVHTQYLPAMPSGGTVVFEVKGQASSYTLRFPQPGDTLSGGVGTWDSGTNTQLVTVTLGTSRPAWPVILQLNNTKRTGSSAAGTGVLGVIAARPGYTIAQTKAQRFTTEFLAFVAPFQCLRFMDWLAINGTQNFGQGADFTKRATRTLRRTSMSYSEDTGTTTKTTAKAIGCCFEDIIDLLEATGKDGWINHSYYSSDAFITAQMALFHAGLTKGQKLYQEYVNEISWNFAGGFDQTPQNWTDTAAELNGYVDNAPTAQKTRTLVSANRTAGVITLVFSVAPTVPFVANGANAVVIAVLDGDATNVSYVVQSVPSPTSITINKAGADGAVASNSGFSLVDARTTSNLVSGGVLNVYTAAAFRVIRRIKEISELTRAVVGNANILTRYRPVFAQQTVGNDYSSYLGWLDSNYGLAAGGRGVSGYLYGIAAAPYYVLDGTPVALPDIRTSTSASLTVADYVSTFAATAKVAKQSSNFGQRSVVALRYGIQHICYEGGPDSAQDAGAVNNVKKNQAHMDAGMKQPYKDMVSDFARYGTNEPLYCMYFHGVFDPNSSSPYAAFGSTDGVTNLAAPKVAAMSELAAAVIPPATRNSGVGTFDARLIEGKYVDIDTSLLVSGVYPWWVDLPYPADRMPYLWTEPAATPQTRTLTISYTCNVVSQTCHVDINGVRVATNQALSASPADLTTVKTLGPFTFTSKPGKNGIELVKAVGNGRAGQMRSLAFA